MTLKQLEYFCAVAQAENISLAARQLYVAQPALSRQISLLEDELGVQLFLRTNRGITLTEAGERLFHQSQDLFSDIRRLKDEIRGTENGMRGQINIGALYSNMPLLNRKLRIFRRLFPDIHIYVRTGSPDDLLVDLRQHKLHLLLLRMGGNDLSEFNVKILREDPLEIITSRELDPAPDMDEIPVERLRGIPMCMLRSDDAWGYNHSLVDFCQKNGFDLNIICQCYDSPMVMQLVQAGIGLIALFQMHTGHIGFGHIQPPPLARLPEQFQRTGEFLFRGMDIAQEIETAAHLGMINGIAVQQAIALAEIDCMAIMAQRDFVLLHIEIAIADEAIIIGQVHGVVTICVMAYFFIFQRIFQQFQRFFVFLFL